MTEENSHGNDMKDVYFSYWESDDVIKVINEFVLNQYSSCNKKVIKFIKLSGLLINSFCKKYDSQLVIDKNIQDKNSISWR